MAEVHHGRPGFSRRKAPRQRRSRVTVDAIRQAALDIAEKDGFGAAGTHEIAARAGVSIGSLYQYFPNREAIYLSLYEQTVATAVGEIKAHMPTILDAPLEQAVRGTIKHLIALYARNRLVLLDLRDQVPELHLDTSPVSVRPMLHGMLRMFLAQRTRRASAAENEVKAHFLEQVMLGSIQNYVRERPLGMSERVFSDHLSVIVLAYLRFRRG